MTYDAITSTAFTASASVRSASARAWSITRYVAPRLFGLWLWSVAIVFAGLAYVGRHAYESGQLFRAQFNEGYQRPIAGLLAPACDCDFDPDTFDFASTSDDVTAIDFNATAPNDVDYDVILEDSEAPIFPDVTEQVMALNWQQLRKLGKALGYTHKTKSALLEALTVETNQDDLYEAYQDVINA